MGKLLILTSCCIIMAACELDTNNFLSFQDAPKPGHLEAVKDEHMQQLFAQLLGKRSLHVGPQIDPLSSQSAPSPSNGLPEVMFLHKQLQNKLGWGSDDNNNQQYGPPGPPPNQKYGPPGPPPNQQYGPPPNQQYGPPPPPPNQNHGPPPPPPNQNYGPPPNQQYGPPPPTPNQNYGPPPPPPNQNYGPPPPSQNQQYGPPPPPLNQQYGPPQSPPSQNYGPPPSQQQNQPNQEYGPPSNDNNKLRVNQGTFGGHIENFKLTDAIRNNNNKNKDYSGPAPSKSTPSSQYGSPAFSDNSGYNDNDLDDGGSKNAKIYKHVYIHTPSSDFQEEEPETRVIRPNKKQDTHYQIIFVKAPAPPKQALTEIELPAPAQKKTLVYVLVKKPEKPAEIKFRTPKPTQPAKPEVYFIRYKGNSNGKNGDGAQDLLSQIDSRDIISSNSRPSRLNDVDDEEGYTLRGRGGEADNIISNILSSRTKDRDSVGYPNAEYRAPPSMISPNDEPMSFAVYDRVRNEKVPSSSAGGLVTAASDVDLIVRRSSRKYEQKQGGSHYTAPGSLPFERASGRMTNGQYLGMTSNILRNQYYSPQDEVK